MHKYSVEIMKQRFEVHTPKATYKFPNEALDDNRNHHAHTKTMNDITRDELRSTLTAIEERMDRRVDRMATEFQREMALRDESFQREAAARHESLKAHIARTDEMGSRLELQFAEAKNAIGSQKYWLAGIGVAVVLGIMGANATIFSGGKSFFDGGVEHSAVKQLLEETKAQSQETRALLEALKAQQATPQVIPPPSAPAKP